MSTQAKARPVYPITVEYESTEPIPSSLSPRSSLYRYATPFAKGKRVLDVNCGLGVGTELLAGSAAQAYGCDEHAAAIEFAATRISSRSNFLLSSEDAVPFADNSFDLITAFELLPGSFQWQSLVLEAARVLGSDGTFLASFPAERPAGLQIGMEIWSRVLAARFRYILFVFQRLSDASLIYIEPHESAAKPVGLLPVGYSPFVALCTNRPSEALLPSRSPFSLSSSRDRESHIQWLRDELQIAHSFSFALQHRHDRLLADIAEQSRWAERLDAALGATQATLRLRERQMELLNEELDCRQQEIDKLRYERRFTHQSTWVRLGSLFGLGPIKEQLPLGSIVASFFAHRLPFAAFHPTRWFSKLQRPQIGIDRFLSEKIAVEQVTREESATQVQRFLLYCLSPVILLISFLTLMVVDLCFAVAGKKRITPDVSPRHDAASIIIPNWNGRELLRDFLPSVVTATAANSRNEIIVVDNNSQDGSTDFLRKEFPQVRILPLPRNCGFGGACRFGVGAARNQVVVLLNNDMRVEPDFLPTLLQKFSDPKVFAVSSQIFFADPTRRREETGLTETWWQDGHLGVTHHIDPAIKDAFPCAYPGGGSSAFDRRKFMELGGFDDLFRPFYYEDTDLGRLAWKRGWKVLYDPASVVHHNHRGTIGRTFSSNYINGIVRRNAILYCWKNIHDWRLLSSHFFACAASSAQSYSVKASHESWCTPLDSLQAFRRLKQVIRSRWLSNSLKTISDVEAFRRPLGGYYRDRFLTAEVPSTDRLSVLFVSPYSIEPPVHGGAVFMKQTLSGLASRTNLNLISFVDNRRQLGQQEKLRPLCQSVKFIVRPSVKLDNQWTLTPNGVREFRARELAWSIHRAIYRQAIDVLQLEYTVLGQYAAEFHHIPCFLFEHDISMQSLSRRIRAGGFKFSLLLEFLRLRIYEPRLMKRFARVQVCSRENADYLRRTTPQMSGRIDSDLRAAIEVGQYPYVSEGRESDTLLFIGSFRHNPNVAALAWFTAEIFPRILASNPQTILMVVGSDPPTHSTVWNCHPNIRLLGTVPDVRVALQRHAVFICPILSGSGVRVKLLEAFASGIPCVSTKVGAEGLAGISGESCEIADSAELFSRSVLRLLNDPIYGVKLAHRARTVVERDWSAENKVCRLEQVYRNEVNRMRTRPVALPLSNI